jgi:hypothetical protein
MTQLQPPQHRRQPRALWAAQAFLARPALRRTGTPAARPLSPGATARGGGRRDRAGRRHRRRQGTGRREQQGLRRWRRSCSRPAGRRGSRRGPCRDPAGQPQVQIQVQARNQRRHGGSLSARSLARRFNSAKFRPDAGNLKGRLRDLRLRTGPGFAAGRRESMPVTRTLRLGARARGRPLRTPSRIRSGTCRQRLGAWQGGPGRRAPSPARGLAGKSAAARFHGKNFFGCNCSHCEDRLRLGRRLIIMMMLGAHSVLSLTLDRGVQLPSRSDSEGNSFKLGSCGAWCLGRLAPGRRLTGPSGQTKSWNPGAGRWYLRCLARARAGL